MKLPPSIFLCDERCERLCVKKLENRAVAVADFGDIIGYCRVYAEYERFFGKVALALNVVERAFGVDFDDSVGVQTIHLAVCAFADNFTAFDGEFAESSFDLHHLGETRHIENFVDVGGDVDDFYIRVRFAQTEYDAKPRR